MLVSQVCATGRHIVGDLCDVRMCTSVVSIASVIRRNIEPESKQCRSTKASHPLLRQEMFLQVWRDDPMVNSTNCSHNGLKFSY